MTRLRIVILGLSVTSSWGNGHATNYRGLMRALTERGDEVVFLERDQPWYAAERDLPEPPFGRTELYSSLEELRQRFFPLVRDADAVILGSYVPEGIDVARWVTTRARGAKVFYDIDTPVTLAALERGDCSYLVPEVIPGFDLYLSFTGGPALAILEDRYGARRAVAFHCMVDAEAYSPLALERRWDLGYLGTYSKDRQPALERLLLEPARLRPELRFVVAGPAYPPTVAWPDNVQRIEHVPPGEHPSFYCAQRLTLNITRADMVALGWSPSVRLFEAAACEVPVVSDRWDGLDSFFSPGKEILIADEPQDVLALLDGLDDEARESIGRASRARVIAEHTAEHRAGDLGQMVRELSLTKEAT